MHVFFISPKWMRNDPTLKEAVGIEKSYLESGLGTSYVFNPDGYYYEHKKDWNFALIEKVIEERPNAIFFSWINSQYNPPIEVFSIFHKMGIPVICWWWDFMFIGSREIAKYLSPFIHTHLMIDTPLPFTDDVRKEKYRPIWPQTLDYLYFKGKSKRQIPVSFPGGSIEGGNVGPRAEYIEFLKKNGVDLFVGGTRWEETTMQYADNLRRTKLVLNISPKIQYGVAGKKEMEDAYLIKGRAFEAISCGAALLEPANSFLSFYFKPDVDYITYDGEQGLLDKINYYLAHEKERAKIAESGYQKMKREYNSNTYWNTVINLFRPVNNNESVH